MNLSGKLDDDLLSLLRKEHVRVSRYLISHSLLTVSVMGPEKINIVFEGCLDVFFLAGWRHCPWVYVAQATGSVYQHIVFRTDQGAVMLEVTFSSAYVESAPSPESVP